LIRHHWYNGGVARRNPDVWFWQMGGDLQRLNTEIGGRRRLGNHGLWEPRIDLMEDEAHFYLKVELAGVRGEDLQLLYLPDSHSMLVKGVRREEECFDVRRTGCHQLEIYYGEFEREIELPQTPIEPGQVKAQFRNGFLYALIPKAKVAFRHTKVSIRKV
jgi:HSP20 family protein